MIAKNISIITCCFTNTVDIIIRNPITLTGNLIRLLASVALIPFIARYAVITWMLGKQLYGSSELYVNEINLENISSPVTSGLATVV
jgi:hypothetical protein